MGHSTTFHIEMIFFNQHRPNCGHYVTGMWSYFHLCMPAIVICSGCVLRNITTVIDSEKILGTIAEGFTDTNSLCYMILSFHFSIYIVNPNTSQRVRKRGHCSLLHSTHPYFPDKTTPHIPLNLHKFHPR